MPIVEIHLLSGYAPEAKHRLATAVTDAVTSVIPADPQAVTVMTRDYPAENYMRGGQARSGAVALPDPQGLVRDFLAAMEARDLQAAEAFLGEGFTMTFPGNVKMTRLQELVDWAKPRYARVAKTYEHFDTAPAAGHTVVTCFGTLGGEWLDGTPFGGIRFIDRFEVTGGKLTRQDVWNDMGEVRNGA